MAGFLDRAKEAAQRGLDAGKDKVEEVQATRAGQDLLRRLGAAYYAERRGAGTPESVNAALQAVETHIREHGDAFLHSTSPFSGGTGPGT
ncbi:hypothetical protein POF50_010335 [Streptomyces sp. SL13]|uniref:Uncharacterized protein n=1 Tax=Streptantibioticus silvisoli TaxID=2705255 RepID=A0AA90K8Q9_9ACTN|nr:hypothetical protein [Streptantibioticus silvisoli]MDI5962902.1 hypothetical protein [Streptantibioticus silvisoli]MDI5969732.1 hypothetical protein [Streptantibioticus silvisoli]